MQTIQNREDYLKITIESFLRKKNLLSFGCESLKNKIGSKMLPLKIFVTINL